MTLSLLQVRFLFLAVFVFLSSCAGLRRLGVGMSSPIIYQATGEQMSEGDWDYFRESTPASLKLVETMLVAAPNNSDLLATLTKGHTGYAYGVLETLYLNDKFAERGSTWHHQAIAGYARALNFGMRYLKKRGITFDRLRKSERAKGGVVTFLDRRLKNSLRDVEVVFFSAQSIIGMINLQKSDISMVGNVGVAKGMFDWVCSKRKNFNFNACDIFYASYYSSRPRMLGGNPAKGRKIFERLMKQHPENWLARVAFVENYIIPMGEENLYKKQRRFLKRAVVRHSKSLRWSSKDPTGLKKEKNKARLYRAIAVRRFRNIDRHYKELF